MSGWPARPVVYEVNTWVWLREVGAGVPLAGVPPAAWDEITLPGVDAVWLMGVWDRSPEGLRVALADESLVSSFREALPELQEDDVVGSPYCVRGYVADARLGGREGLAAARAELARRGVRLLLDYVPNHVAPDHPWVHERPDVFVAGSAEELRSDPAAFLDVDGHVLARGRDPYFPPWPDVVQLNAFSTGMRDATVEVLDDIGDQCDGVRCDMAMLLINDVFAKTWGDRAGSAPAEEFWPQVLGRVRERHPDMLFVAEAYWDLEGALQVQGFDHCYDKRLYDRLVGEDARSVTAHLGADLSFQDRLVRFLENHDEPRAASALPPSARERVAAVVVATLPGLTLWHEGQLEGRRVRLPVFLARRPEEEPDGELRAFYTELIAAVSRSGMRRGAWRLLGPTGWPDNATSQNLVAWCWEDGAARHLVVVNLCPAAAQGQVRLPWSDLPGRPWELVPVLHGHEPYDRSGDELADPGLFVDLPPWGWHVLEVRSTSSALGDDSAPVA